MRNSRLMQLAVALGLTVAFGVPAAFAAGQQSAGDVSKFKDEIQKQTSLSESDINAIEPQLREFSQRDASPGQVAGLAKTAVDNNCTGPCLRDVLTSMNSALSKGLSSNDAQDIVSQTLRDQVQARGGAVADPSELGSQIRASVDAQLAGRPGAEMGTTPGMAPAAPAAPAAPMGEETGQTGGGY